MAWTQPSPAPPPSRTTRRWPWVVLLAGVVLAVAAAVPVGLSAASAARQVARGNCLPNDFPRYAAATTTGVRVFQGATRTCDMVFDSPDSAGRVMTFYASTLDVGDWRIAATSLANGTITFERRRSSRTHGQVQVIGRGVHSSFQVHLET
jgi:hypothetical protein